MKKRYRGLTPKQQDRIRKKVFKLLEAIGFKYESDGYYWRKLNDLERLCVACQPFDQLMQSPTTCWCWKTTALNTHPNFGYSGTTSIGCSFATAERIIETTLDAIYYNGMSRATAAKNKEIAEIKEKLAEFVNQI